MCRDSEKQVTHALLAVYVASRAPGVKPETEDTLMMSPRCRSTITERAAWLSRMTARTFSRSSCSESSSGAVRNPAPSPRPALLTSTSTGRSGSDSRASTAPHPSSSARSTARISTSTSYRSCTADAVSSSRFPSRATSTRSWCSNASRRQNAAPIPEVAPVTNAVGMRPRLGPLPPRQDPCAAPVRGLTGFEQEPGRVPGMADDVTLLLRRATFGPRPAEIAAARAAGYAGTVDALLRTGPDLGGLPALGPEPDRKDAKARRDQVQQITLWWLDRMATAMHPFTERLT